MYDMKLCKHCNKEFLPTATKLLFCESLCQRRWAQKITVGKPKPGAKTGSTFKCLTCLQDFYVPKYRIKTGKVKYCSRSCLAKNLLPKYVKDFGFKKLNKPKHNYKTIYINGKQYRLHRYIMEQHLGRKLERWEHVHHINDDSHDNRLENLVVVSNSDHQKLEYKFRKKIISSS